MSFANSIGDNPNAVGKDQNIWDLAYMTVLFQKEEKESLWAILYTFD